ncbi:MAG: hypothetical protein NT031_02050, partial [Planctomycetota bacterium]|nr:hypothetical protein [Planctomycetota bacterium]
MATVGGAGVAERGGEKNGEKSCGKGLYQGGRARKKKVLGVRGQVLVKRDRNGKVLGVRGQVLVKRDRNGKVLGVRGQVLVKSEPEMLRLEPSTENL